MQGVLYEIVYIDLDPAKRDEMLQGGNVTVLPQLHVNGVYRGDYEELQDLEDRGDLDFLLQGAPRLVRPQVHC